jgi:ADP-dependent NAD(P)H-hydrate dehydratase / NAD(P)H-hydrate epimerase
MEVLWTAAAMRELDRRAIEEARVPSLALMESAGAAAARVLLERFPEARRVAVACGPGNNGGDGFVVARRLHGDGLEVRLLLAPGADPGRGDAAAMLAAARGVGVGEGDPPELGRADVVVDALLGTGSRGAPEGDLAALVRRVNEVAAPVLALDGPSGVDGTSGEVVGDAVQAAVTVCFGGRKLGTAIEPGRSHAGTVVTVDIGLPAVLAGAPEALRVDAGDLDALPSRSPTGSKYDAGAVLVVGGSPGLVGAPSLAAQAALHAGAGVVWACVPREGQSAVAQHAAELMVHGNIDDPARVLEMAGRADVVVLGPGLGRDDAARRLVDALVDGVEATLLCDADALFALAGRLERLRGRPAPTALTPHAGELARLLGRPTPEVSAHRLTAVREAAEKARCAVLLKGPDTLVAAPGEPLRLVETAVPALATAGAGDVLSGVSAAVLARGVPPAEGLALAAAAHGAAARVAATAGGTILASDLFRPVGRLLAATR